MRSLRQHLGGAIFASVMAMALGAPPSLAEAPAPSPIVLGESYAIPSKVMGDERTINVYLPDGYASGTKRYPVLYLIDGGMDQDFVHVVGAEILGAAWGRSQDAIVVGIASKDRRDELTGPTADKALLAKYPTAGHSARFRTFIRDEVKPLIEARYRTNGNDGVLGESLAGLFIVETWLRDPSLFRNYAASSPSLWWDNAALADAAPKLAGKAQAGRRLYVFTADQGGDDAKTDNRLAAAMTQADSTCFVPHREYTHSTIYHAMVPAALQFLFPGAEKPGPQWGFTTGCPETKK